MHRGYIIIIITNTAYHIMIYCILCYVYYARLIIIVYPWCRRRSLRIICIMTYTYNKNIGNSIFTSITRIVQELYKNNPIIIGLHVSCPRNLLTLLFQPIFLAISILFTLIVVYVFQVHSHRTSSGIMIQNRIQYLLK